MLILCLLEPQVEETVRVDESGFIMEDIYEDVTQPFDAPPEVPPPKEPAKPDTSAPSLPPRNPNAKSTVLPSVPSLPPRNTPSTPTKLNPPSTPTKLPSAEPEGIMEEFYEDMDEVKAQYENTKNVMEQANADQSPVPLKKELSLPQADAEKKSPLLKKKELKKEKEQQKKEAKEAKKKEKENKKLKKEKKSSTLKSKTKSADLKVEDVVPRSSSFTTSTASKPEDEEYVIEELPGKDEEKPSADEPAPIDDEIYEDVVEPPPLQSTTTSVERPSPSPQLTTTTPSYSIKKPSPPPAVTSTSTNLRAGVFSPPGKVSDYKRNSSPVAEPPRSQSISPSNVKIRTTGITVSSISKPKNPTSVTPVTTMSPATTSSTKTTSSDTTSSTTITTTTTTKVTSSPLNKPRVRVSEAIYKFQKRSSTMDAVAHKGTLFHKAPGRTRFRQEYCEISGTVMSFYREKGDEKAFGTLNLEECELHVVKEQYEGRRHVFSLAAGSAIDLLSAEFQVDLQKWLSTLEPLVKKYVKEE